MGRIGEGIYRGDMVGRCLSPAPLAIFGAALQLIAGKGKPRRLGQGLR